MKQKAFHPGYQNLVSGIQNNGGGRIRTFEGVSRQIYSLIPLAAREPLRKNLAGILLDGKGEVNWIPALVFNLRENIRDLFPNKLRCRD